MRVIMRTTVINVVTGCDDITIDSSLVMMRQYELTITKSIYECSVSIMSCFTSPLLSLASV